MKVKTYRELEENRVGKYDSLARTHIERLLPKLMDKYKDNVHVKMSLIWQLPSLFFLSEGNLEGKKILDLGCGSNNYYLGTGKVSISRMFEPWLCRGLYELGLAPIGIDFSTLEGEEFEHYELNLLKENALEFIPSDSIDIANARSLFDSPYLHSGEGFNATGEELKEILIPQLERIVKPNGWFVYQDD